MSLATVERVSELCLDSLDHSHPTWRNTDVSAGPTEQVQPTPGGGSVGQLGVLFLGRRHIQREFVLGDTGLGFQPTRAVELREVETTADHRADPTAMAAAADADTVLVFCVAGSTEYGRVDPVPELAEVAADVNARCHVDAAFGGFFLPFTDRHWSFADAPIDTMTIDPHKAGRAAIPAGSLLARERKTLDALAVETPYLASDSQASLGGTRSGAGVASANAAIDALWPAGYRAAADRTTALAEWFAEGLADRGYEMVDPVLPVVSWRPETGEFEQLRDAGWKIARTGNGEIRVVVMPHVTRAMLDAFLVDLDAL